MTYSEIERTIVASPRDSEWAFWRGIRNPGLTLAEWSLRVFGEPKFLSVTDLSIMAVYFSVRDQNLARHLRHLRKRIVATHFESWFPKPTHKHGSPNTWPQLQMRQ